MPGNVFIVWGRSLGTLQGSGLVREDFQKYFWKDFRMRASLSAWLLVLEAFEESVRLNWNRLVRIEFELNSD